MFKHKPPSACHFCAWTAIARQLSVIVGFFAADILWRITRPVGAMPLFGRRFPKHGGALPFLILFDPFCTFLV